MDLKKILKDHKKWLETEGTEGKRTNLRYADLRGANLCGANLRYADLRGANLCGANLRYANLCGANLCGADLCGANLSSANLNNADLNNANLCGADLSSADLSSANLNKARLRGANLSFADLSGADLCLATLYNTDLSNAKLSEANLNNAFLDEKEQYRLGVILSKKIIGYKKCEDDVIVKLEIPKGAIVFCINGSKCRTNKAKVLEIIGADKAVSKYDETFIYETGKTYEIKNFNLMYNVECGTGIHFFKTEKEAKEWLN